VPAEVRDSSDKVSGARNKTKKLQTTDCITGYYVAGQLLQP